MANTSKPVRHGLSNSGIDTCPKCGSDIYLWKEGVTCAAPDCDYNVDHEQWERDQVKGSKE